MIAGGSLRWLPARMIPIFPMAYPAMRPLPKLPLPLRPVTARHGPYLLVRLRVWPERHRAQSCAIALRSPAPRVPTFFRFTRYSPLVKLASLNSRALHMHTLQKPGPSQLRKVSPAQLRKLILHKVLEQPARRSRLLFGLTLFVAWRRYTAHVISSAEEWGPRWLANLVAKAFSMLMELIGARLVRHHAPPPFEPGRRHMVVWHPHAAYTTMALMHTATMTVRGSPLTWFTCVAPILFTVPGLREALLLLNARSCDPKVVEGLAGSGVAVGLQPGGVPEQLRADHTHEARGTPARPDFEPTAHSLAGPKLARA
jgi:hypothetical protein